MARSPVYISVKAGSRNVGIGGRAAVEKANVVVNTDNQNASDCGLSVDVRVDNYVPSKERRKHNWDKRVSRFKITLPDLAASGEAVLVLVDAKDRERLDRVYVFGVPLSDLWEAFQEKTRRLERAATRVGDEAQAAAEARIRNESRARGEARMRDLWSE